MVLRLPSEIWEIVGLFQVLLQRLIYYSTFSIFLWLALGNFIAGRCSALVCEVVPLPSVEVQRS